MLEACDTTIDMLLLVGVSIEESLGNVLRWFREVVRHAVRHAVHRGGSTLRRDEDLRDMAIGFPPVERPIDVGALAMELKGAAGAIAEYERVEDVIRSAPHDV